MGSLIWTQAVSYLVTATCAALAGWMGNRLTKARRDRRTLDELTLMVCRLVIYNDKFSIDEKVDAYRTYREHGGNSKTKHYMDRQLGEDADGYLERHK